MAIQFFGHWESRLLPKGRIAANAVQLVSWWFLGAMDARRDRQETCRQKIGRARMRPGQKKVHTFIETPFSGLGGER
ncbi:hypothetical protein [Mesorhizobium sp.]|uniref:hypothetical protein n=1 Tax=Mesorhizobium sp. TaxID=1871066 RepID=UPI000FE32688|nr:hypothetical protein [Mesorhizobium sp.]RWA96023.1 MAG: hypothetical protein EOQ33_33545 [Mesorhizobium sp.]RWK57061.1 MAG: hypothetical protein EOR49_34295 [Mesorhizobium sp.]RWM41022.1 MAG: hypothetical protein EOR76_34885 [Mesorhizobium sp.]RWM44473.1 MAG: hypothetical protein EOR78_35700 [Mesorhizobium sp.]RWM45904.1 MAG: hypothetical protein EOR79_35255 [Mesorhizobium sp.]